MRIVVVEDDKNKREFIEDICELKNIDIISFNSIMPAIKYVVKNFLETDGIILDLGLTNYDDSEDYDSEKGLILVKELNRKKINIPILINSTTEIDLIEIMRNYPNVKGQMASNYKKLDGFINSLTN